MKHANLNKTLTMKRKTVGILIALLMLVAVIAGSIMLALRDLPQKRLLNAAEDIVFVDADSAVRLLAQVDTMRLSDSSRMLYDMMRALADEEKWYQRYADTVSCFSMSTTFVQGSKEKDEEPPLTWCFSRKVKYRKSDDKALLADSTLLHIYHYYERESLGGTTDDKETLRRFGRICLALSRHHSEATVIQQLNRHRSDVAPLQHTDKLLHLAIYCAEACDDHALAYRAYRLLSQRTDAVTRLLCLNRALEHFRHSPDHCRWLLTLLNDYGCAVLAKARFDLHRFSSLQRIAALVARHHDERPTPAICDSVYQCLDSLADLPAPRFGYSTFMSQGDDVDDSTYTLKRELGVPISSYEDSERKFEENKIDDNRIVDFDAEWQKSVSAFNTSRDTYLASGYVMKTASLQRRLMTAAIVILLLTLLLLAFMFRNWRIKTRQRYEAERADHQRETALMAERLRQKDTMITMLRGHIMDKSEILDMLEPTAGKRTIINARNWREIEVTLDTADGNFVSRLRAEHPSFTDEDIRLCMLTRLRLSNTALSAIYAVSVSAVQHRKQKLKKEGFGVIDPAVTFDQIIADF